ncbi:GSCOCG00010168001-RA-CDS [Cotesia congregata]|nr:GSCOCG00010168001-RA-CDS [Cotesia congregata]
MSRDFYLKKYRTTGSDRRTKNKDRRTDIPSESIEKDPLVIDLQEQLLPKPPARKPRRNQKQKKGTQRISQSQLPIEDIKVEPRNTPSPEKSKNKTKKMSERVNESVGAPVSNRLLKRVLKVISQTKRAKNDNAPATSSRTEEIKSSILASNATQVSANDLMLVLKDAEKTLKDLKENRNYLKNPCFKNSTTTNSKKSDRPLNQQETSTQTSPPANKNNSERPTLKDNKTRQIRNEPFRTERSYSRNVNTYQHPRSLREQSNNTIVHSQRINTDQAFETTPRNYKPFNYSDSPNVQLNNSFFQPPNNGYQAICNPQLYSNPPCYVRVTITQLIYQFLKFETNHRRLYVSGGGNRAYR